MTLECCCPLLERIFSLKSKGLRSLEIGSNPQLITHAHFLLQILQKENLFVKDLVVVENSGYPCNSFEEQRFEQEISLLLKSALGRNERLAYETHQAAFELLTAARVILLGSPVTPASASPPILDELPGRSRTVNLPFNVLKTVLSFLGPSALSERQVASVLRYAADRRTLELRQDYEGDRFLQEIDCFGYDC